MLVKVQMSESDENFYRLGFHVQHAFFSHSCICVRELENASSFAALTAGATISITVQNFKSIPYLLLEIQSVVVKYRSVKFESVM